MPNVMTAIAAGIMLTAAAAAPIAWTEASDWPDPPAPRAADDRPDIEEVCLPTDEDATCILQRDPAKGDPQ